MIRSDAGFMELVAGVFTGGLLAFGALVCMVLCVVLWPEGGE